jgi:sugar O-acyltransferase (sialic acid O-acetyltransferase NeuD family)
MTTKKSLIIIGGGGFCREVIWLARECSSVWEVTGILDDNPSMLGKTFCDISVIGSVNDWPKYSESWFVVAIGSPRTRKTVVEKMKLNGNAKFATLVHPSTLLSDYVEIGEGSIITAGCVLTTQISLGRHNITNLLTSVGHDVVTGDYCTMAPHVAVSGNVTMGDGVEVGTGALLIQGRKLGTGCFVGAGAVVSKDIPENILAVGCPARQVKSLEAF